MRALGIPLLVAVSLGRSAPSFAQAVQDQSQEGEWAVQLTPYVWGTALSGEVRPLVGSPKLEFDESFSDVLENLDGAFFLTGLARRNRLILFGDLSWSSSSQSGLVGPGVPASGQIRQTWVTLAGGYRVADGPGATLDLLLGARAWNTNASVSIPVLGLSAESTFSFTDPLLMARYNLRFAPSWSALFYGDIGGFGVGSEESFQAVGTLNYQVSDQFYLSVGYRYLTLDYQSDGRELDLQISGPIVGATWQF
ncbi:MAG: hypothetical protein HC818_06860 [Synechococcaceae cyanobacterium RM1_1_27]|nr:hypothetical protein [Synechococcaceae cyanobacterium SM2_3_2]NJO86279.1 hypothetical protein [Synechococcaceae cyanobacterium RM1_1_27]